MTPITPGRYVSPQGKTITVRAVGHLWMGAPVVTIVEADGLVREVTPSVLADWTRIEEGEPDYAACKRWAAANGWTWRDAMPDTERSGM